MRFETLEGRALLTSGPAIAEFMAANAATLLDEDGSSSDWIELHNPTGEGISLEGWYLSDDRDELNKWRFPDITIDAGGYIVIFASGKDRVPDRPSEPGEPITALHTNFKLSADGEYLGLIRPDLSVAHEYAPRFPKQIQDVSYGFPPSGTAPGFLDTATPGGPNSLIRGPRVAFDRASGLFRDVFLLSLSAGDPAVEIRFTIDGSAPNDQSPKFVEPLVIGSTTLVQAIASVPGAATSTVSRAWFVKAGDALLPATSNLPIVVLENFGAGRVPGTGTDDLQFHSMTIFEPDNLTGRSGLHAQPQLTTQVGIRERGSSGADGPKQSFTLEAWDENGRDQAISPLGLPAESDWILYAPLQFDRALIHNPLIYELSNQIGRYAPRTRFVEVYHNTDGGDVSPDDYVGVYVLTEKIKVGPDRVDIAPLKPDDSKAEEISGGWLLKIDRGSPDELFQNDTGIPIQYVDPEAEDVTPEQAEWILQFINGLHRSLGDTDPSTGYAQYIDVDSWIDHHILNVLPQNPDAFRYSGYFFKDRQGKLQMGPVWDFDRTMDSLDARDNNPFAWEGPFDATNFFLPGGPGQPRWWSTLFEDANFKQRWIDRWFELRQGPLSDANIELVVRRMADELEEAAQRNFEKWGDFPPRPSDAKHFPSGRLDGTFRGEVEHTLAWLLARTAWIDRQFVSAPILKPQQPWLKVDDEVRISAASGTIYFTNDGTDPRRGDGTPDPAARAYNPTRTLVSPSHPARYRIAPDSERDALWWDPDFDDAGWAEGSSSLGFDTGSLADLPLIVQDGFSIHEAHSTGAVTSFVQADRLLRGFDVAGETRLQNVPLVNYAAGEDEGLFLSGAEFPGGGGDHFALRATATLSVRQEGRYTFGSKTNDGARLVVDGQVVISNSVRGAAEQLGTLWLSVGEYQLDFVMYQGEGTPQAELFFAPGEHTALHGDFLLLGDTTTTDFTRLIETDVGGLMREVAGTAALRIPFVAEQVDTIERLYLDIRYDDGFVAYLNGVEIARRSAPESLDAASVATGQRLDVQAIRPERIDITSRQDLLREGHNLLAVVGLNLKADDADFLLAPALAASFVPEPILYSGPIPLTARVLDGTQWSAPVQVRYVDQGGLDDVSQLVVEEIHYHPPPPAAEESVLNSRWQASDFEFIELLNRGNHTLDLAGVRLRGAAEFTFAEGESLLLAPGQYAVLVRDRAAFAARYGSDPPVVGRFTGPSLDDRAGTIELTDRWGHVVHEMAYGSGAQWPQRSDGLGSSLERIDAADDSTSRSHWRLSDRYGGSPGTMAGSAPAGVRITEVFSSGTAPSDDWIELRSVALEPLDLGGWSITDDLRLPRKYSLPAATILLPRESIILRGDELGFSLDGNTGGLLYVLSLDSSSDVPEAYFTEQVAFGAAEDALSLGRWPGATDEGLLVNLESSTPGAANRPPRPGALTVSEIHYQPAELPDFRSDFDSDSTTGLTPVLGDWRVEGGHYIVTPPTGPENDTVALLSDPLRLSARYSIETTVRTSSLSTFNRNAVIVFDYHSPEDFKFASLHANINQVRIGERNAAGWQFHASTQPASTVAPDTDLNLEVRIDGSRATLLLAGREELVYQFTASLSDGAVGVGSRGGQAFFDRLGITPRGEESFAFVEIANNSGETVDLSSWRLQGTVAWTAPAGTKVDAGQTLIVVGFDPVETALSEAFGRQFDLDAQTRIVGPYSGRLNADGLRLELLKPATSMPSNGFVLVDLMGDDVSAAPWLSLAAGGGQSLQRAASDGFGRLAASWIGGSPTPGRVEFLTRGDLSGDGQLDTADLAALAAALQDPTVYETARGIPAAAAGDLDRDGDLDYDDIARLIDEIATRAAQEATAARRTSTGRRVTQVSPHETAAGRAPEKVTTKGSGALAVERNLTGALSETSKRRRSDRKSAE